jgi:hypothetical protein
MYYENMVGFNKPEYDIETLEYEYNIKPSSFRERELLSVITNSEIREIIR